MDGLALLFASHSLPRLLVEAPEFKYFVGLLDPRLELPNRKRLADLIRDLHLKLMDMIRTQIEQNSKICIIIDIWTRKGLSESYLGVLITYFDYSSGSTKKALIGLRKMIGSHTAENIRDTLREVLSEWNIPDENISFYVTDSGANIIKALKECVVEYVPLVNAEDQEEVESEMALFEAGDPNLDASFIEDEITRDLDEYDNLEEEHNTTFGYAKRVSCIMHQIARVIRKCVDGSVVLRPIIRAAFQLVKTICRSRIYKESLLQYSNGRALLLPSQTRWIYTYYVLDRLLELKDAVKQLVVEKQSEASLDSLKWKQIEQLRDLLRPFAEAVRELYPVLIFCEHSQPSRV